MKSTQKLRETRKRVSKLYKLEKNLYIYNDWYLLWAIIDKAKEELNDTLVAQLEEQSPSKG